MDWYYAIDDQQRGPVSQEEFDGLLSDGTITLSTLVWRQGLPDWQPYSEVATARPAAAATAVAGQARCAECGRAFPVEDMIAYSGDYVCAECKPVFFERVRQGVPAAGEMRFAGFWIRFVAKFVDSFLLGIAGLAIGLVTGMSVGQNPEAAMSMSVLMQVLMWTITGAYFTAFVGAKGATPGKMMLGLKVVRSDGSSLSYARALGRWVSAALNYFTLYIGWIIAAFDSEKRGLHDHICDTRVIWVR